MKGIDTTFLLQLEVREHPGHAAATSYLKREILEKHDSLALAPQVLLEFIHIVTDPKRFDKALSVEQALGRATYWWTALEVRQIVPSPEVMTTTLEWLQRFQLGRKRLLDTQLAATYYLADIRAIISSNVRDFTSYGYFEVIDPVTQQNK